MSRFLSRLGVEIWRPVPGYVGLYEASNLGRVRSLPRKTYCGPVYGMRGNAGRVLKQHPHINGYMFSALCKNGKPRSHDIHRIIATVFCPRPAGATEVDHIDRNNQNNIAANLRWVHSSDNKYNSSRRDSATSKYNGVKRSRNKWRATVRVGKKVICLGTYSDEIPAARAFDEYCAQHKLNRRINHV